MNLKQFVSTYRNELAIFLLAFGLRAIWSLLALRFDPFLRHDPLHGDAASYHRIVVSLLSGTGFAERPPGLTSFWPPLYPWFLQSIYTLFGVNFAAARMVQALLGAAAPLIIYGVVDREFGRKPALLTAVGLSCYPLLLLFTPWLIAETLYMTMLIIAFALFQRINRERPYTIFRLGLWLGLCILAKPTTVFFMPFWALWLFAAPRKAKLVQRLAAPAILAIGTLLAVLPWTLRNYSVHNTFLLVSTNGGYTFLGANNPNAWGGHDEGYPPPILGLNEVEMEQAYYAEAWAWIRSEPQQFAQLLLPKYRRLFSPLSVASIQTDYPIPGATIIYTLYGAFLLLAILGLRLIYRRWRSSGYLLIPVIGILLSAGLFYGDARYTLPAVPTLVLAASLMLQPYENNALA